MAWLAGLPASSSSCDITVFRNVCEGKNKNIVRPTVRAWWRSRELRGTGRVGTVQHSRMFGPVWLSRPNPEVGAQSWKVFGWSWMRRSTRILTRNKSMRTSRVESCGDLNLWRRVQLNAGSDATTQCARPFCWRSQTSS